VTYHADCQLTRGHFQIVLHGRHTLRSHKQPAGCGRARGINDLGYSDQHSIIVGSTVIPLSNAENGATRSKICTISACSLMASCTLSSPLNLINVMHHGTGDHPEQYRRS
jgi:hypothetical protein